MHVHAASAGTSCCALQPQAATRQTGKLGSGTQAAGGWPAGCCSHNRPNPPILAWVCGLGLRMGQVARSDASLACSTRAPTAVPAQWRERNRGESTVSNRFHDNQIQDRMLRRAGIVLHTLCQNESATQTERRPLELHQKYLLCAWPHDDTPALSPAPGAAARAPAPRAEQGQSPTRGEEAAAPA